MPISNPENTGKINFVMPVVVSFFFSLSIAGQSNWMSTIAGLVQVGLFVFLLFFLLQILTSYTVAKLAFRFLIFTLDLFSFFFVLLMTLRICGTEFQ